jgi:ABC-type transporter Mla subunit MlaD
MNLKSILTKAANFSDKATDVIDNNRDKLVSDFEQAVARQRAEFIQDITTVSSRLARSVTVAACIVSGGLVSLGILLLLRH